jgi:hypothetical protein
LKLGDTDLKPNRLAIITFLLLLAIPSTLAPVEARPDSSINQHQPSNVEVLHNVPYVWQEINGFCAWAALSMALQYIDVELDLHDVLAASTIGFSFANIRFNDTLLVFPGAIYTQAEPTDFVSDLYGVNYTIYLSAQMDGATEISELWRSEGINVGLLNSQDAAFDIMRSTVDDGYPLLISVDPSWLPAEDYDYLRERGLSGGAHGVLIVGYNDTDGSVTISDPGVGAFGENFGYPTDNRGNYTKMTYTALNTAWSNRFYISNTFKPTSTENLDQSSILGPMVRDKLLGVASSYTSDPTGSIIGNFGEKSFRALSEDITVEGLLDYIQVFDGMTNEQEFKAQVLFFIGVGLESSITLQYLSYRTAVQSLQELMPDINLDSFLVAAQTAIPHFDALSDNSSLVYPGNISMLEGSFVNTFIDIVESYNASGDLNSVLDEYESELNTISQHLLGVADSWLAAGNALAEIWPNNIFSTYGVWIALGGFGAGAVVVALVLYIRKTPSQ